MNAYESLIVATRRLPEESELRREAEGEIKRLQGWSPEFRNEKAEPMLRKIQPAARAAWEAGATTRAQARAKRDAARRARQLERVAAQPAKGRSVSAPTPNRGGKKKGK